MKIQNRIRNIRKKSYGNWNYYKFEDHNKCPFCNTGTLRLFGQVSNTQVFICNQCKKSFELDAITEEIVWDENMDHLEKVYQIDYEIDNGVDHIEDTAFIKATSATYAKMTLKNYIFSLPNDLSISQIFYIGCVEPTIITGKFGIK